MSNHRDGAGRVDGNYGSRLHYEPNSFGQWQEQPDFREPPLKINGDAAHWNFREDDDDYFTQPRKLFQQMSPEQKQALFGNTARAMGDAPDFIRQRHIDNCTRCEPGYGSGVAAALGMRVKSAAELSPQPELSAQEPHFALQEQGRQRRMRLANRA